VTRLHVAREPTRAPGVAAGDLRALGTLVRVVVTEPTALDAATLDLVQRLEALDLACSRFRPDSEVRRIDHRHGRPARVSPLLAELVGVALRAARLTDGDVDPTVGRAMETVGYDRDFAALPADGPALRVLAGPVPGWRGVELDRDRGELTVPPGVLLDLGATAKAWAADDAAVGIARRFDCGVLVSLGGDVAMAGPPPVGGWPIRVQDAVGDPDVEPRQPWATVVFRSGGVATSSVTARRWLRGGTALHHVLDPRTGMPARSPWRTVTVAAASCVDANIASTASIVRGDQAVERLRALRLPARLVSHDGAVTTVAGWPADGSA
jgi:thiamine biosynthesis lipoprotein ApbE